MSLPTSATQVGTTPPRLVRTKSLPSDLDTGANTASDKLQSLFASTKSSGSLPVLEMTHSKPQSFVNSSCQTKPNPTLSSVESQHANNPGRSRPSLMDSCSTLGIPPEPQGCIQEPSFRNGTGSLQGSSSASRTPSGQQPSGNQAHFRHGRASTFSHRTLIERAHYSLTSALHLLYYPKSCQDHVIMAEVKMLYQQVLDCVQASQHLLPLNEELHN